MKPKWLIQTNMEDVDVKPMMAEVAAQGMEVWPIEHDLGRSILGNPDWPIDLSIYEPGHWIHCIIAYGDIDFVRQVNKSTPFIPGAYCNFHNMKCSTYYTYLGGHLLNQQYLIMPVGELLRRWDDLTLISDSFSTRMPLFIRPDSGAKPFTGYVVKPDDKHEIQSLVQVVGPETLVIISPEKIITAEWRFVICDKKVIAGSQYLPTEQALTAESIECNSPSLWCLAQTIASQEWQPDLCYTVDIAESGGDVYLLEVNSFSCAGLYSCDLESVVREVSLVAMGEWREYHV